MIKSTWNFKGRHCRNKLCWAKLGHNFLTFCYPVAEFCYLQLLFFVVEIIVITCYHYCYQYIVTFTANLLLTLFWIVFNTSFCSSCQFKLTVTHNAFFEAQWQMRHEGIKVNLNQIAYKFDWENFMLPFFTAQSCPPNRIFKVGNRGSLSPKWFWKWGSRRQQQKLNQFVFPLHSGGQQFLNRQYPLRGLCLLESPRKLHGVWLWKSSVGLWHPARVKIIKSHKMRLIIIVGKSEFLVPLTSAAFWS